MKKARFDLLGSWEFFRFKRLGGKQNFARPASGLVQKVIDRDGTFAFQVPPPGEPK